MLAQTKIAGVVVAEVGLIVAQTTPTSSSGFLSGNVFDAGTTIAALGLLAYLLRMLTSGDLVSRQTIQSVVESAVRETLREERRND